MNKLNLTFILLFISFTFTQSQTLFVKSGGAGDGYSWESPLGNLRKALQIATPGTEIWVAKGTYFPSACENCSLPERSIAFQIPSGVKVYGGFAGYESTLEGRNLKANPTILNGNIGREDQLDNSQTVVYFENVDATTTLDGFFITEGFADKEGTPGSRGRSGAGIFNVCSIPNGTSNPTISNCILMDNQAWDGAAIFNHSEKGNAMANVVDCRFIRNKAKLAGAAILDNNHGDAGHSAILNCGFILNEAEFGAGYFTNDTHQSTPLFKNCIFIKNKSKMGSAIFIMSEDKDGNAFNSNNTFKNNETSNGNDVQIFSGSKLPTAKMLVSSSTDL